MATGYVTPGTIERVALQTALTNYALLLAGITSYFQAPNQQGLDAVTSLATAAGYTEPPRVTYTVDGENEQWTEYQTAVVTNMQLLRQQVQQSAGPFRFRSRS